LSLVLLKPALSTDRQRFEKDRVLHLVYLRPRPSISNDHYGKKLWINVIAASLTSPKNASSASQRHNFGKHRAKLVIIHDTLVRGTFDVGKNKLAEELILNAFEIYAPTTQQRLPLMKKMHLVNSCGKEIYEGAAIASLNPCLA
jgi:hypothetical protein